MGIRRLIRQYMAAIKNHDHAKAAVLKPQLERRVRVVLSRYTQGKEALSHIAAFFVRVFGSAAGREKLNSALKFYVTEEQLQDRRWLRHTIKDVYFSEFYNRINPEEYFRYHFEDLSKAGRYNYVSVLELDETFRHLDAPDEARILYNKYRTYQAFSPYYRRDVILVSGEKDREAFTSFCERHPVFFAKPLGLCGGKGVRKLTVGKDGDVDTLFCGLFENGSSIVEEPIRQGAEMARFHPQSINTVRVVTSRIDGEIQIVQTSVRLGTGDSIVDNGCLSAAVDEETGIITTPGRAAHVKGLYLRHPDTGIQILGSQIPEWNALLEQVKEQAAFFRKQRTVGWDMAYSEDGWLVVEANSHPHIQVLAGNGIGARRLFDTITK